MGRYSRIIAFAGRKRSGKGMLAQGMKAYNPNVVIVTIADNLKFLCCDLLNTSYERLNEMKDDGTTFTVKVDGRWVSIIHKQTNIPDEVICKEIGGRVFTNVREILQVIGTDLIRKYVPDWHIDKTIERINSYGEDKIIAVDDVRFPNEKCKIEALGGDVFFLIRPNCWDVSNHPSETALNYTDFCPNRVLINDYPKENFITYFNALYFNEDGIEEKTYPILLVANPWYSEHVMDMTTDNTNFNAQRDAIAKQVIKRNLSKPQFLVNGIITFETEDNKVLQMFRHVILNDKRNSDGCTSYSLYNPLTNENLKKYM